MSVAPQTITLTDLRKYSFSYDLIKKKIIASEPMSSWQRNIRNLHDLRCQNYSTPTWLVSTESPKKPATNYAKAK